MNQEQQDTFSVDKSTGTFADPLVAYGLAWLLHSVTDGDVTIHDAGPAFQLTLQYSLDAARINAAAGLDLLPFLLTKKTQPPAGMEYFDYEAQRAAETAYFAARRLLPKRVAGQAPDESGLPPGPHHELPLFKLINQMSALTAYNEVVCRWQADQPLWPAYVRLLANLFAQHPNKLAEAEAAWKELARAHQLAGAVRITAAQILNPAMGKGGDAPKANNLAPGNKDSFWLVEYLKFVGVQQGALPLVVRGSKNRKTYVPIPVQMEFSRHRNIMDILRSRVYAASAIKLDVLADLEYTRIYLQQWLAGNDTELKPWDPNPGNFVSGLAVGFYKDLGSALALLNLSQIRLPQWMPVVTVEGADHYLGLLTEHTSIVRGLNEDHSDEYALLQSYRDFLSGRDLDAFYDFAAGYAHVLMSLLERHQPARPFTLGNLEVLLMGHNDDHPELATIISNEGFRNLATAIRLSTIVPQGQKARSAPLVYDVRYGLGDELKRKSGYPHELAQALGEFVHSYNQETMQVLERTGQQRRKMVTEHDLDQVLGLINVSTSRTVGNLLIAYGYARSAYQAPAEGAGSTEPEAGGADAPGDDVDDGEDAE